MNEMKLLFLRGQVPTDRDPRQIMFDDIEACDDVWTQLAYKLCQDGYGEVWYWGGKRKTRYKNNFIERWVPSFKNYKSSFKPDVIFARGGFPQYDIVLERNPQAYRIYYGAGRRFFPRSKFKKYDLILVDTPNQLQKARRNFSNTQCALFIKPAADNIFRPQEQEKVYDVIFSSNEHKSGIKGHDFILPSLPRNMRMIQTGIVSPKLKKRYPYIDFQGWLPRKRLPQMYAQSKVAIVCCTNVDSCPRVIPEALACGCPLLILDSVNLWSEKYITEQTGRIASSEDFICELQNMIDTYTEFSPYNYYTENLSLAVAADYVKGLIGEET